MPNFVAESEQEETKKEEKEGRERNNSSRLLQSARNTLERCRPASVDRKAVMSRDGIATRCIVNCINLTLRKGFMSGAENNLTFEPCEHLIRASCSTDEVL